MVKAKKQESSCFNRFFDSLVPAVGQRFSALDGLRGLAALSVMFFHYFCMDFDKLTPLPRSAGVSVTLFFALSAFLLFHPIASGRKLDIKKYYLKRVLRIYPAYLVAIALSIALIGIKYPNSSISAPNILSHLFFVHTFTEWHHSIVGPAWSLGAEVQFYLLLPLIALALRKNAALKIGIAVLLLCPLIAFRPQSGFWLLLWGMNLPYLFLPFLSGIVAAYSVSKGYAPAISRFGLLALIIYCFLPIPMPVGLSPLLRLSVSVRGLLLAVLCYLAIVGMASSKDYLVRLCNLRALRMCGICSYGIYIYHHQLFVFLRGSELWVVAIPVALILAVMSYLIIEMPAMQLLTRTNASANVTRSIHALAASLKYR
jgi:peptidoglycan/LPS O-acetylase OafA/YrhL